MCQSVGNGTDAKVSGNAVKSKQNENSGRMMSQHDSTRAVPSGDHRRLQAHYDRLWSGAIGRIRAGDIEADPVLAAGRPDRRRGLTVIARPGPEVRRRVAAFLGRLRAVEPNQHYYARMELHVTVLSLFTATVAPARFFARTGEYADVVDSVLEKAAPFRIEFVGVTVSPGAILIQGFCDETLNRLRDALRGELRSRGLGEALDERYRLETAHLTVVRFQARLRESERFAAELERARAFPFGATDMNTLSLVRNDWYMTRQIQETVKCYRLGGPFSEVSRR